MRYKQTKEKKKIKKVLRQTNKNIERVKDKRKKTLKKCKTTNKIQTNKNIERVKDYF